MKTFEVFGNHQKMAEQGAPPDGNSAALAQVNITLGIAGQSSKYFNNKKKKKWLYLLVK